MAAVKVDADIWRLIKNHYLRLENPTSDDERVRDFIIAKLAAEARRSHYLEERQNP